MSCFRIPESELQQQMCDNSRIVMIFMVITINSRHTLFISQSTLRCPPPSVLDNKGKFNFHTLFAFELLQCHHTLTHMQCAYNHLPSPPSHSSLSVPHQCIHSIMHAFTHKSSHIQNIACPLEHCQFATGNSCWNSRQMQMYEKFVHLMFNRPQQCAPIPFWYIVICCYHYHLVSFLCMHTHTLHPAILLFLSQSTLTISKRKHLREKKIVCLFSFVCIQHTACILVLHTRIIIILPSNSIEKSRSNKFPIWSTEQLLLLLFACLPCTNRMSFP